MINRNLSFENARIGFRNFSGKEGQYNPKGNRVFSIFLDTDVALELEKDGWLVKWLEPRDPHDDKQAHLPVKVSFGKYPPKIVLISTGGKTVLDEDDIKILDWAEVESADIIVRPYNWEVNGKSGVKAYLKVMYITTVPDEFEEKYRNVPDSASSVADDDEDELPF